MKYCNRGIQRSPEVKATINAQSVHTFTLHLRTTIHASGQFMCTGRYHLSYCCQIKMHGMFIIYSKYSDSLAGVPCMDVFRRLQLISRQRRTVEIPRIFDYSF